MLASFICWLTLLPAITLGASTPLAIENAKVEDPIFFRFGTLHTMEQLSKWAWKEEQLCKLFQQRVVYLEREIDLITSYLESYKSSSGTIFESLRYETSESFMAKGIVIASSAMFSHLMTYRYASVLSKIRQLLIAPEYREIGGENTYLRLPH